MAYSRQEIQDNTAIVERFGARCQTTNVIDRHPEIVEKMRAAYDAWWKEPRPLMVNENVPMSRTRPFHELYKKQLKPTGIPAWQVLPL